MNKQLHTMLKQSAQEAGMKHQPTATMLVADKPGLLPNIHRWQPGDLVIRRGTELDIANVLMVVQTNIIPPPGNVGVVFLCPYYQRIDSVTGKPINPNHAMFMQTAELYHYSEFGLKLMMPEYDQYLKWKATNALPMPVPEHGIPQQGMAQQGKPEQGMPQQSSAPHEPPGADAHQEAPSLTDEQQSRHPSSAMAPGSSPEGSPESSPEGSPESSPEGSPESSPEEGPLFQ